VTAVYSVALMGLAGHVVEIEAWVGGGYARTQLVGLPDASLSESQHRCRAAVSTLNLVWPDQLVTINLTPATLPKAGSHYDLGIAVAVLCTHRNHGMPDERLRRTVLLGELGLDGRVRDVRGLLPALLAAVQHGFDAAIVPIAQVGEASLVRGIAIHGVATLTDAVAVLRGEPVVIASPPAPRPQEATPRTLDLADVVGQEHAKRVLEVAAAGRHHLFLYGPPGVGKTMLAERLPSILPELSVPEALEVMALRSLADRSVSAELDRRPPYAAPHHTASAPSVVGGGPRLARPGAVSLAHRGVLFMDEAPEFPSPVLEALRVPLEKGQVMLSRSEGPVTYPARFQLVMAANPCPCGNAATVGARCTCTPMTVRRYASKLSGPVLDRVDLQFRLPPMTRSILAEDLTPAESSATVLSRVTEARQRQAKRLAGTRWTTNGEVTGSYLRRHLPIPEGTEILDQASRRGTLSARGIDKVLKIAWTLADLDGRDVPMPAHVFEALGLRRGDQGAWG
jgi:magnesium chelatase family protein